MKGFIFESQEGYRDALEKAESSGLPQYHIRVRYAVRRQSSFFIFMSLMTPL
jgi:hypothetical protein